MPALDSSRRNMLESTVLKAREAAEAAARAAFLRLGVEADQPSAALNEDERVLRRSLRAKRRQLGSFIKLVEECAYQHWHRMMFARFLAESHLLIHPEHGVPVTLEECKELAPEEGAADAWTLAARYASRMLPEIFRQDDPLLEVTFSPEDKYTLEKLLGDLPHEVFGADDSLGWVYQFWQKKRKDDINASEVKIDRDTIGPVTQLFTEHYMVQFLLQNTLGAWWVSRHPDTPLPHPMSYLRFLEDGTPAAGTFPGWPETARELRVLDPCCGSGHFLVAAFRYLTAFRMAEEGLSEAAAGEAVLRDNLFGLEIDARCTQIAAFNLALAAWRRGGYRPLPPLNVACSGLAVGADLEDWLKLANGDHRLQTGMKQLWELFQEAPDLGSLIDPKQTAAATLFAAGFAELQPLLLAALQKEQAQQDEELQMIGVTAQGMAKAGELLAERYHLVTTNVPYLVKGKQAHSVRAYIERLYPKGKNDLATAFLLRCLDFAGPGATIALVTPQNWRLLVTYSSLREEVLRNQSFNFVVPLGPRAFETITGEVVNVGLFAITRSTPSTCHGFAGLDATAAATSAAKASVLRDGPVSIHDQAKQLSNPDCRIVLEDLGGGPLLGQYATASQGVSPADLPHYGRCFWELPHMSAEFRPWQSTVKETQSFGGRELLLWWGADLEEAIQSGQAYVRGEQAWGRDGVVVTQMQSLPCTLYTGECFDTNAAVIVPHDARDTDAVWAFCTSPDFRTAVRKIDQKMNVTNATLVKVPFDVERWRAAAEEAGPLPEPYSEDPTQWLFDGNPARTTEPLQVAVARLLGYRWPQQEDDHGLSDHEDHDGIVCLPALRKETGAAERLRELLAAAYGGEWTAARQEALLAEAGFAGRTLAEWLREGFFAQHCKLFHQRPFIWQVWDGRRDGFSALVNYHKLDFKLLERLTYGHLGDWISRQRAAVGNGEAPEDALLKAQALQEKLKLILQGEPPYDLFVRWKPLHELPLGWHPDLNDGVRMNIRPFMEANILRAKPNIKWGKDRGKNPPGAPYGEDRLNDRHFTLEEKQQARAEAGGSE